jgi:hypothetical protein
VEATRPAPVPWIAEWNLVANPPNLWRDASSTVETKAKPEAKKVKTRTYTHPESQAKWDALLEASIPLNVAEQIADLDYFGFVEVGDFSDILRSASRLTVRNVESGKATVNHPGYLVLKEMQKRNRVYEENQRRYAAPSVA